MSAKKWVDGYGLFGGHVGTHGGSGRAMILWMVARRETMVEIIVGWYLQGNQLFPGFLKGAISGTVWVCLTSASRVDLDGYDGLFSVSGCSGTPKQVSCWLAFDTRSWFPRKGHAPKELPGVSF